MPYQTTLTCFLDWKRWCLRGHNGIKLTEQEINLGLDPDQLRKTLVFDREIHTWSLEGNTLTFITSDEGHGWTSVSELTDIDLEEDEDVKPSTHVIGNIDGFIVPPKRTSESLRTDSGSSTEQPKLVVHRQPHKNDDISESGMSATPASKVPNLPRLSSLRKSARTTSALRSSPSGIHPTTPQGVPSSHLIQTPIRSSQSSQSLVVLIKRRAPLISTKKSVQRNRSLEGPNIESSSAPDLLQPASASSALSKRVSRPSLKKRGIENDGTSAKRRRIDEFENGNGTDNIPAQTFAHQAPLLSTNSSEPNNTFFNSVQPSERSEGVIQCVKPMQVEVSVQTTPVITSVDQGTQTNNIWAGSEVDTDRDVVIRDSTGFPSATIAKRATFDIAVQAELNPSRDDRSHQMGNGITDDCTSEMQNNLSFVVDNLVSTRLLSLTRGLKQSTEDGPMLGSATDRTSSPVCGSATSSSMRGTSGADGHFVNALFDELRLLREEAHAREQRIKDEMRALRQLHNAEVDSLRRRLAYLESQSHDQAGRGYDTRRAAGEYSYSGGQTHSNADDRTMPSRFGDERHQFRAASFGAPLRTLDRPVSGPSNGNDFSRRYLSRSGNDVEEDNPLPSKAQRKSHIIAFSRPSVALDS